MQPVPAAPTAAGDGGLSTHVSHTTRLHAKRPILVQLRVIHGPFEGECRLQSGGGAWSTCNTSPAARAKCERQALIKRKAVSYVGRLKLASQSARARMRESAVLRVPHAGCTARVRVAKENYTASIYSQEPPFAHSSEREMQVSGLHLTPGLEHTHSGVRAAQQRGSTHFAS